MYQEVEEVQWRALRALVQLAYDNPEVSWLLLHNWVKEARQLAKEEDKVYADLREQVKKDVANVDENLRARAKMKKEEIERMKGRPMGPAALMTAFSDERAVSWRVKECLSLQSLPAERPSPCPAPLVPCLHVGHACEPHRVPLLNSKNGRRVPRGKQHGQLVLGRP